VNCLTHLSLGRGAAGQFLVCLGLFCMALCRVFLPYRLCFGSVLVLGPRKVTKALWNTCCAAAVATGLTGSVHRSGRCSTGSKPCKFPLCVLVSFGSEGCLLVHRSSSTPVAAWVWPTLVVSRRHVLEDVFVLLESPTPSRRIFIGSHSLPPSLVRRIGPSQVALLTRLAYIFLRTNHL
jgi:hypothetical protein